jgi:hypothetical protein
MGERDQLESQWDDLTPAERFELFSTWILSETEGFQPAELVLFEWTGGDLVIFGFSSDLTAWQVAVADSLFTNDSPSQALGTGDGIIETGHLFAEQQEDAEELEDEEQEDESVEGQEHAHETVEEERAREEAEQAALESAIHELEGLAVEAHANYEAALADDDLLGAIYWHGREGEIQTLLIIYKEKLDLLTEASD